jgi:Uncharacterized conserved protein
MTITSYHLSKISNQPFSTTVKKVTEALREEGFGIITEIDIKETFREKLNVYFRNYLILGACNPRFAYETLMEEDKVGVFLPCNVVIQEHENGKIEVSIVDPEEMVHSVDNLSVKSFATQLKTVMQQVLSRV